MLLIALLSPMIPNIIYFIDAPSSGGRAFSVPTSHFWLGQIITSFVLLCSPLFFGARPRTTLLCIAPFAVLSPVLAAYAIISGYPPSLLILQVLRQATMEQLSNFIPAIVVCATLSLGLGLTYVLLARWWGQETWVIKRSVRLVGLIALIGVLGKDIIPHGLQQGIPILVSRLSKLAPVSPYVLAIRLGLYGAVIPDRAILLTQHTVTLDPAISDNEVCILVLGESVRKRAMGLYNPQLDTTPLLAGRDLVIFTDATSCGTASIQAVPILLTGRFPSNDEFLPFSELGLVGAFRLAGFKTHWLSSQKADGQLTSFITAFSTNAEERRYRNGRIEKPSSLNPDFKYDDTILPVLSELVSKPGRHFIVLQTLGSHLPYTRRYPSNFEKWPVSVSDRENMWRWFPPYNQAQRIAIDNAYYNSIYYTDWVLDQVISILEASGRSSSMIYLSDHGDNDSSALEMPANHGIVTPDITNIPFFMWFSESYRDRHADKLSVLQSNTTRRVSAQDVFSTLCDLNGLQLSAANPTRSLASPSYTEHPRFVYTLDGRTVPLLP